MLVILAEESANNTNFLMQVASGFASLGFAVWYAWHTTTKSIPKMQADHKETVERIVSQFRDESKEMRAAEATRNERSMELAVSGHEALRGVTSMVAEMKEAITALREARK